MVYRDDTLAAHLAVLYPYHHSLPFGAGACRRRLGACSLGVGLRLRSKPPAPGRGLVLVSDHAGASHRFGAGGRAILGRPLPYIPSIGLFVLAAWGANELVTRWVHAKWLMVAIALMTFIVVGTTLQVQYWRNSFTLFSHALDVTTDNTVAHLEPDCATDGMKESLTHYDEVLRIRSGRC